MFSLPPFPLEKCEFAARECHGMNIFKYLSGKAANLFYFKYPFKLVP